MEATSKAVQTTGCSEGLWRLKRQFDQWRAGRRAGERIPSELWAGAVAAAAEHVRTAWRRSCTWITPCSSGAPHSPTAIMAST